MLHIIILNEKSFQSIIVLRLYYVMINIKYFHQYLPLIVHFIKFNLVKINFRYFIVQFKFFISIIRKEYECKKHMDSKYLKYYCLFYIHLLNLL
jgi:hypothetical protein